MSEEDFLSRWSRRKREVAKAEDVARPAPAAAADTKSESPAEATEAEPAFDLASLPPLESINELSDITAFLREGVPAELTRAALRRVWTADASIRDFVGLAENAWDFTDPNAMPGFGPLEATEEVRRMIARVVGEIGQSVRNQEIAASAPSAGDAENSNYSNAITDEVTTQNAPEPAVAQEQLEQGTAQSLGNQALVRHAIATDEPSGDATEAQERPEQLPRRSHGRALPH